MLTVLATLTIGLCFVATCVISAPKFWNPWSYSDGSGPWHVCLPHFGFGNIQESHSEVEQTQCGPSHLPDSGVCWCVQHAFALGWPRRYGAGMCCNFDIQFCSVWTSCWTFPNSPQVEVEVLLQRAWGFAIFIVTVNRSAHTSRRWLSMAQLLCSYDIRLHVCFVDRGWEVQGRCRCCQYVPVAHRWYHCDVTGILWICGTDITESKGGDCCHAGRPHGKYAKCGSLDLYWCKKCLMLDDVFLVSSCMDS